MIDTRVGLSSLQRSEDAGWLQHVENGRSLQGIQGQRRFAGRSSGHRISQAALKFKPMHSGTKTMRENGMSTKLCPLSL